MRGVVVGLALVVCAVAWVAMVVSAYAGDWTTAVLALASLTLVGLLLRELAS